MKPAYGNYAPVMAMEPRRTIQRGQITFSIKPGARHIGSW